MLKIGVIGHNEIRYKDYVELEIDVNLEEFLLQDKQLVFNFGSKSKFDDLVWTAAAKYKSLGKNIMLVDFYCGSEHPILTKDKIFGMKYYDKITKPQQTINCGRRLYIERNKALIDDSDVVLFYYNGKDELHSGTAIAYKYALSKGKKIINIYKIKK